MLLRDNSPKKVMVISDFPLENEIRREVAYSEPSQTTLKDALNNASIIESEGETTNYLNSLTICYTYLSTVRYEKGDTDFAKTIVSKRSIPEDEVYTQVPWLRDTWVHPEIWMQLQACIAQIKAVNPDLIIIAGKWAFMFLCARYAEPDVQLATITGTKNKGTDKKLFGALKTYRSSLLTLHAGVGIENKVVLPILTPAYLFLVKDSAFAVARDYNKIARIHNKLCAGVSPQDILASERTQILGETKEPIVKYLNTLLEKLDKEPTLVSVDVETRHKHIDCIGLAYETERSLTIPFSKLTTKQNTDPNLQAYTAKDDLVDVVIGAEITVPSNYWNIDDEIEITHLLFKVLLHENCLHVGQNYNYDCQFYYLDWKLAIHSELDTMILNHVLYNYMEKNLAYLASIYCDDYVYWKDEINVKDNLIRWKYNGKDCCYTLTIANILKAVMSAQELKLQEFYKFQQYEVTRKVLTIMRRGVKVDLEYKERLHETFLTLQQECIDKLNYIFNEEINLNSTQQVKRAFKDLLGIKPILNRKTKRETFGADAMLVYLEQYPEFRTILTLFLEYKSIKVFVSNFLAAKVDDDGHMRCDYNPAGTKTYRFNSRKNVLGNGMNLANVPAKGKIDLRVALEEVNPEAEDTDSFSSFLDSTNTSFDFSTEYGTEYSGSLQLPNCKKIFLPSNEDWVFFDVDYSSGDLHFVAWDSECEFLKNILKNKGDVYSILASHYYQREITKADYERQIFKAICHGCVTADHEVLTKDGWVKVDKVADSQEIAVWDLATKSIWFETPKGWNRDYVEAEEDLFTIEGAAFSFLGTQDHKFPATTDKPENIRKYEASKLPASARIPYTGNYTGGTKHIDNNLMRLIAALQADGTIDYIAKNRDVTFRFKFVRKRKIERMRKLLQDLGIKYKEWLQTDSSSNGNTRTCFSFKNVLEKEYKKVGWWLLDFSPENLKVWKDELKYWDGTVRTSNGVRTSVTTVDAVAAEVMQTIIHLTGQASKVRTKYPTGSRQTNYEVSINSRQFHNVASGVKHKVKHTGTKVYCPQTSTGFFMLRRNGNIYVSGNTNYLGKAPTLASKANLSIGAVQTVQNWYFSKCPEISEWHKRIEMTARSKRFVENIFGARFWVTDFTDQMWLNKIVAAIPQSSVAILVNKGIVAIENNETNIQVRLQVHDSAAGQYLASDKTAPKRIIRYMEQVVPYKDPLVIPADIKVSAVSYGDCGKIKLEKI